VRRRPFAAVAGLLLLLGLAVGPGTAGAAPPLAPVDAPELRTTWFFAEGATAPPFDTWLLLFNPNAAAAAAATATVTFFGDGPIATRTVTIAPNTRASLFVNQFLPNAAFGMRVDANIPIAAERAMYFRQDGTVVVGVPEPRTTWLFAEGATAQPFDTWFLLLNPNTTPATATLTFFFEGGGSQSTALVLPPLSRRSVFANQVLPPAAFSTRITSDQPIVAERSMFKISTGGGHAVAGVPEARSAWFFAEGATVQPFDTWYLFFNPNANPVRVLMRFFPEATGPGALLDFTVPPNARQSLFANLVQPNVSLGATVVTEGGPIVVERAIYFGGGAHASQGAIGPDTTWFFAEGSTAFPFQQWYLLVNPSAEADATATLTFFVEGGAPVTRSFRVPGQGRISIFTDLFLPQAAVSTRVSSDRPIVVERSMYFGGGNGGHNTIGIPGS